MPFEWQFDVTDGVMKNHTLSQKIREAAIPMAKFLQVVDVEPGYGRRKGDSITITRIRNIAEPANARISEQDRIPIDTYSQSSVTITVTEWGRGVEYTHKSELLNHYDEEDKIQKKLRQQLRLVLDTAAAAAYKTAKIKFIPDSPTSGVFDTDGVPSTVATSNGAIAHIKLIRDYMMDTIHAPGWNDGDEYVSYASTKFLRGIKNDPEFLQWRQYSDVERSHFKGEVGSVESVRFVEINHTSALANNKGTGGVLGEALVFGDDTVAMAIVEDPELRAAIPADFGRQKAVAWYGVLEFGLVWDTPNDGEARVIHITSQ